MPRDGSGVYSLPPGSTYAPNTTIESAKENGVNADLATDANTARPITAGGTGRTTARLLDGTWRFENTADPTKLLAFDLSGLTTATTRTLATPDKSGTIALTSDVVNPANLALAASVGSSALTISLKGADGNDPSATNVVNVPFRNTTLATGTPVNIAITAATSLVISSGSTMGFTSATAGRLWIVGFNDGGTFRLGAVNCLSGVNIMALRDGIYSSTAEGGAGGADSAQVIYTGTAVTSKALAILGYMEWPAGLTTAGTWAIVPPMIQLIGHGGALPGEVVQAQRTETGTTASGTTIIPLDLTIPQITEGDQYMTLAVTPSSAANLLVVSAQAMLSSTVVNSIMTACIFRDATANALASASGNLNASAGSPQEVAVKKPVLAGSASSTTFRLRAGDNGAGTTSFNGFYGGTYNSYIEIQEVMA